MSKIKIETIEKMQAQKEKLDARIQQLKNRQANEERKKSTRQKILAGAFFIKLLGNDIERVGLRLQEAGWLSSKDLALFGLSQSQPTEEHSIEKK